MRRTLALLAAAVLAGCLDSTHLLEPPATGDPILPGTAADHAHDGEEAQEDAIDVTLPRLKLTITLEGVVVPKTPVTLRIEGVAMEPITGGEVRLTLPTKAEMDYAGPGNALYFPTNRRLPVEARWQLPSMAKGGLWSQRITVPAMEKGYYHVALSGIAEGPPADLGPFLIDDIYRQVWVLVADQGSQLTEIFDPSVFPEGARTTPGPLLESGRAGSGPSAMMPDTANRRYVYTSLSYYNGSEYVPAAGTKITGYYYSRGRTWNKNTYTVPESGIIRWTCPGSNTELRGYAIAQQTQYITEAEYKLNAFWDAQHSECGDTVRAHASRTVYLPWHHLNESAELIQDHFGYSRGRVKWRTRLNAESSYYTGWRDRITFNAYGNSNWWTAAHEYGHAYHHKALGGMWSTRNCNPHYVRKVSSYTCAFSEGFADYAGNVGAPDDWDFGDWETWDDGEGSPKGKIEGYVAALFHDLIDETNETDDETSYPPDYIAAVFKTCKVGWIYGGSEKRNDVSDFVWCLENRVNVSVHNARFPGILAPNYSIEYADEPDDWDADDIRSTWIKNVG